METVLAILAIIFIVLVFYYEPNLDEFCTKGGNKIVILWFNQYQDGYIHRAYIRLWEHK